MFSQLKNNGESKFSFNLKANIFIPKKSYRKAIISNEFNPNEFQNTHDFVPINDNLPRFQNDNTDYKFSTLNPEAKIFVPSKEKTNDEHLDSDLDFIGMLLYQHYQHEVTPPKLEYGLTQMTPIIPYSKGTSVHETPAWESFVIKINKEDSDEIPLYHTPPSPNKVNEHHLDETPLCQHLGIHACDSPEEKSNNKKTQCQPQVKPQCVSELRSNIISNTGVKDETFDKNPKSENVFDVLKNIRIKNVNNIIFATLNVNSFPSKFDLVKTIIQENIDILIITESKLDETFPMGQFFIDSFTAPYQLDRNIHGGGALVYIREDIPSKQLNCHIFPEDIEGIFVEINLRKTKWLLFGSYHPPRPI